MNSCKNIEAFRCLMFPLPLEKSADNVSEMRYDMK